MPLSLEVPFSEKDQVKLLGAWWSAAHKTWVIPDHVSDITKFKRWIPYEDGFIIRKPYQLITTARRCWKCDRVTPMLALAGLNYYSFEYTDENDPASTQEWIKGEYPTLFCNAIKIDTHVVNYLKEHYPLYKPTYSKTQELEIWANNCQLCGKLQGEWHNHNDFGGAFCPEPFEHNPFEYQVHNMSLELDYHIDAEYGSFEFEDL